MIAPYTLEEKSVTLELSDLPGDLEQIVALHRENHINSVDTALWATEGFVSLQFTLSQLIQMKGQYKHVVAKKDGIVIGYALVLLRETHSVFPFLNTMFRIIDEAVYNGEAVSGKTYFVMGQICVQKAFRGKGLFRALYKKLKEQMSADFELVVTEVSLKNERSVHAHKHIGFRKINDTDIEDDAIEWKVIAWDWK
jgi:GNAT superfamily N-acetyltransferase